MSNDNTISKLIKINNTILRDLYSSSSTITLKCYYLNSGYNYNAGHFMLPSHHKLMDLQCSRK